MPIDLSFTTWKDGVDAFRIYLRLKNAVRADHVILHTFQRNYVENCKLVNKLPMQEVLNRDPGKYYDGASHGFRVANGLYEAPVDISVDSDHMLIVEDNANLRWFSHRLQQYETIVCLPRTIDGIQMSYEFGNITNSSSAFAFEKNNEIANQMVASGSARLFANFLRADYMVIDVPDENTEAIALASLAGNLFQKFQRMTFDGLLDQYGNQLRTLLKIQTGEQLARLPKNTYGNTFVVNDNTGQ